MLKIKKERGSITTNLTKKKKGGIIRQYSENSMPTRQTTQMNQVKSQKDTNHPACTPSHQSISNLLGTQFRLRGRRRGNLRVQLFSFPQEIKNLQASQSTHLDGCFFICFPLGQMVASIITLKASNEKQHTLEHSNMGSNKRNITQNHFRSNE